MKANGLCDKTCGRCVDAPRAKRKDYDDDYVEEPLAAKKGAAPGPAPAVDFDGIAADVLRLRAQERNTRA
jgi:hypothetical protein